MAGPYYNRQTGDFNVATTWSLDATGGNRAGAAAGAAPLTGEEVILDEEVGGGPMTITCALDSACGYINGTIAAGAASNFQGTLTIDNTKTLDASGGIFLTAGATVAGLGDIDLEGELAAVGVTWTQSGKLTLDGTATVNIAGPGTVGEVSFEHSAGTKTVTADLTTTTSDTFGFTGAGSLALAAAIDIFGGGDVTRNNGTAGSYTFGAGATIRCLGTGNLGGWTSNVANSHFHVASPGKTTTLTSSLATRTITLGTGTCTENNVTLYPRAANAIVCPAECTLNSLLIVVVTEGSQNQSGFVIGGSGAVLIQTDTDEVWTATGDWDMGTKSLTLRGDTAGADTGEVNINGKALTVGNLVLGVGAADRPGIIHTGTSGTINASGNVSNANPTYECVIDADGGTVAVGGDLVGNGIALQMGSNSTLNMTGEVDGTGMTFTLDGDYTSKIVGGTVTDCEPDHKIFAIGSTDGTGNNANVIFTTGANQLLLMGVGT